MKLLSALFSHPLCSALSVRYQVSHPYKTTCKINLFVFREETGRQKILNRMVASLPLIHSALTFPST